MERADYWKIKDFKEFSAKDKNSFAYFTTENRFPKIFKEVCLIKYDKFVECNKVDDNDRLHPDIPRSSELKKTISVYMVNLQNKKLSEQNFLYRELFEQIIHISDYGKSCKDFSAKKDYENRLTVVLKDLEEYLKNKKPIKAFERHDILFFQTEQ